MEARPVKIFSSADTSRLRFVTELIFGEMLGLNWEIVTDRRRLGKCPVINYSGKKISGSFTVRPSPILFEEGVHAQELNVSEWRGLPVLFHSDGGEDLPFDIFAASFFLVSRYEEYLVFEPDAYGRFSSSESVAFKHGFLGKPVVDLWVKELARMLVRRFPMLTFRKSVFSAIVTIDTDEAFAYPGKDLMGGLGGFLHDLASGLKSAGHRPDYLKGSLKDPFYEAFEYILQECSKRNISAKFFFPVGDQTDFDKNPSWKNRQYREMINRTFESYGAGLHPSYRAAIGLRSLRAEAGRFAAITGKACLFSRFHYIRFRMPASFRNLIDAGVREDHSMGYTDEPGFRAGIARSFRFFDLLNNSVTDLRIFPFQLADVMMKDNKKLTTGAYAKVIAEMISQTKNVGGQFVSIWHNTSLLDTNECREWRGLFKLTLDQQVL
ncbi:MAG TPA: hypothetical protein PLX08_12075 [Bacteroidales bacterium]|jgi:hypothetical protein|nr:hypothetical protein [Bacteroidales bacterium]